MAKKPKKTVDGRTPEPKPVPKIISDKIAAKALKPDGSLDMQSLTQEEQYHVLFNDNPLERMGLTVGKKHHDEFNKVMKTAAKKKKTK